MVCNNPKNETTKETTINLVAANIKMYSNVWDEIINKGKLDQFNGNQFTIQRLTGSKDQALPHYNRL